MIRDWWILIRFVCLCFKVRYFVIVLFRAIEDFSINNEFEYENDFKPYSYSKSFSQLSMLAMTPSSSL